MQIPAIDADLVRLSAAVYERPWSAAARAVAKVGWEIQDVFDHAGAEAMLCDGPEAAALIFRGTEASRAHIGDLVANLGRPTRWAGQGWAHSGYARHLERVRFEARMMAAKASRRKPFYVAGHSKGGAMALLYAAWVRADRRWGHAVEAAVTFGAPRVLSRRAARYARPCRQYVIRLDFAQWWPPSCALRHPGPVVHLPSPIWWPGPVSRHGVGRYVEVVGGRNDSA